MRDTTEEVIAAAEAEGLVVPPFRRVAMAGVVRELSKLRPWRSLLDILFDWTVILGLVAFAWSTAPVWTWPVFWLFVASRQHALLIVMHDAAHGLLHRNRRRNDLLGDFLCGWPLFVTTDAYRTSHLRHHRFLNSERDPDYVRKITEPGGVKRWMQKSPRSRVLLELLLDVSGRGMWQMGAKLRRFNRAPGATPGGGTPHPFARGEK